MMGSYHPIIATLYVIALGFSLERSRSRADHSWSRIAGLYPIVATPTQGFVKMDAGGTYNGYASIEDLFSDV